MAVGDVVLHKESFDYYGAPVFYAPLGGLDEVGMRKLGGRNAWRVGKGGRWRIVVTRDTLRALRAYYADRLIFTPAAARVALDVVLPRVDGDPELEELCWYLGEVLADEEETEAGEEPVGHSQQTIEEALAWLREHHPELFSDQKADGGEHSNDVEDAADEFDDEDEIDEDGDFDDEEDEYASFGSTAPEAQADAIVRLPVEDADDGTVTTAILAALAGIEDRLETLELGPGRVAGPEMRIGNTAEALALQNEQLDRLEQASVEARDIARRANALARTTTQHFDDLADFAFGITASVQKLTGAAGGADVKDIAGLVVAWLRPELDAIATGVGALAAGDGRQPDGAAEAVETALLRLSEEMSARREQEAVSTPPVDTRELAAAVAVSVDRKFAEFREAIEEQLDGAVANVREVALSQHREIVAVAEQWPGIEERMQRLEQRMELGLSGLKEQTIPSRDQVWAEVLKRQPALDAVLPETARILGDFELMKRAVEVEATHRVLVPLRRVAATVSDAPHGPVFDALRADHAKGWRFETLVNVLRLCADVEPSVPAGAEAKQLLALVEVCFPGDHRTVRGSLFDDIDRFFGTVRNRAAHGGAVLGMDVAVAAEQDVLGSGRNRGLLARLGGLRAVDGAAMRQRASA